jgi:hypothetical protein
MFLFCFLGDGKFVVVVVVVVALAFIVRTGTFRANGANTAPWAGLAIPWRDVPVTLS